MATKAKRQEADSPRGESISVKRVKLRDLIPDDRNANKGTMRGLAMLENSMSDDGLGRGVLADRDMRLIAGNKSVETAVDLGFEEAVIVPTDGKTLVVTQRTDVSLDSPQGRRMAIRDNRVGQLDLDWDADRLREFSTEGVDLSSLWNESELARMFETEPPPIDVGNEWQGMPDYENADGVFHTLKVHFESEDAVRKFAKLVGQPVDKGVKFIWYPKQEKVDRMAVAWKSDASESDEAEG